MVEEKIGNNGTKLMKTTISEFGGDNGWRWHVEKEEKLNRLTKMSRWGSGRKNNLESMLEIIKNKLKGYLQLRKQMKNKL